MIGSYPKIYNLGHAAIKDLFADEVLCEEKVDGSQISFGILDGELCARSRGKHLDIAAPDNMFAAGVATIRTLHSAGLLKENYVYRGEYLNKPKHNTLAYDRTPVGHIVLFDVQTGHESYMGPEEKAVEARRIGLEHVPVFYKGRIDAFSDLKSLLDTTSMLGGQKIEGVVFKNYARFGVDGHALMGKYVSEAFKEIHRGDWKDRNPNRGDVLTSLTLAFKTPARWNKAIQHLAERGELEGSPRDIGKLVKEVQSDILAECEGEIKDQLFAWASPQLQRSCVAGIAEWYKSLLAEQQFGSSE